MEKSKSTFTHSGILENFEEYVASWTFLFIPFEKVPDVDPGGWGSIPVIVKLGNSSWRTSMFPLKKEGYFLPIKKPIQKAEQVGPGSEVSVSYTAMGSAF